MFNIDNDINKILFQMFHLRNKSHLTNSKATQLAFKSNFISNTTIGSFLAADSLSDTEKQKLEKNIARSNEVDLIESIEAINAEQQIETTKVKKIKSKRKRIVLAKYANLSISEIGLSNEEKKLISDLGGLQKISLKKIRKNFS